MIKFTVLGEPIPQGSMKAFLPKNGKFPIVTADNKKTKPWRQQIAGQCFAIMPDSGLTRETPVQIEIHFYFPRPKSSKAVSKTTKPDVDKLARAVLDALTGVAFEDDSQVVRLIASKEFGMPPRAEICIQEVTQEESKRAIAWEKDFDNLPF
jgi:crossover junction endodeoxyribonuclease RusA